MENEIYCEDCGKEFEEEWGNLIEINGLLLCEKCAKVYLKNFFKEKKLKNT